jgi:methanogenic corrinoid protein MtbC1
MTKDDIIRMAREAGFADDKGVVHPAYQLEAFANLVAQHEREACLDAMMKSVDKGIDTAMVLEREACAKVAEQFEPDEKTSYVMYASKAIRARGNT